jgi:hypothetical protein
LAFERKEQRVKGTRTVGRQYFISVMSYSQLQFNIVHRPSSIVSSIVPFEFSCLLLYVSFRFLSCH